MPSVFLQGDFLDARDARVSAFDAGLQHAVGVFETLLVAVDPPLNAELQDASSLPTDEASVVARCRPIALAAHTRRLLTSCIELGLTTNLRIAPLEEAILRTVAREHIATAPSAPDRRFYRVRCTITGGDLNLLHAQANPQQSPTVLIVAQPATTYPAAMFEQGVPIVLSQLRISPLDETASHKALNYWARLRELQRAHTRGASEALVLDVTNHLVGGCVSSIILVKDNTLLLPPARGELPPQHETPNEASPEPARTADALAAAGLGQAPQSRPTFASQALSNQGLPSCVLPGITRQFALDTADDELLDIALRPLTMRDVLTADETILCNSSWGFLPVIALEDTPLGPTPHKPGKVFRLLRTAWLARQHASA